MSRQVLFCRESICLKEKLGFLMMAICMGVVIVQGSMISTTQGVGVGGVGLIAALCVAFLLVQFKIMSFAELSLMFPNAGALGTYTQKAIGHVPAIVAGFADFVVTAMLALPDEMFLVDAVIAELVPGVFRKELSRWRFCYH